MNVELACDRTRQATDGLTQRLQSLNIAGAFISTHAKVIAINAPRNSRLWDGTTPELWWN